MLVCACVCTWRVFSPPLSFPSFSSSHSVIDATTTYRATSARRGACFVRPFL